MPIALDDITAKERDLKVAQTAEGFRWSHRANTALDDELLSAIKDEN